VDITDTWSTPLYTKRCFRNCYECLPLFLARGYGSLLVVLWYGKGVICGTKFTYSVTLATVPSCPRAILLRISSCAPLFQSIARRGYACPKARGHVGLGNGSAASRHRGVPIEDELGEHERQTNIRERLRPL
jgi:hypothetical protein